VPMLNADGSEYRPWITDVDADLVRRQLLGTETDGSRIIDFVGRRLLGYTNPTGRRIPGDLDLGPVSRDEARPALLEAFDRALPGQRARIIRDMRARELISAEEAAGLAARPPADLLPPPPEPVAPPPEGGETLTEMAK